MTAKKGGFFTLFSLRIISVFVLTAFVSTQQFVLPALADAPVATHHKSFPTDLDTLKVPANIGKIQETFKGDQEEAVILIQDAHAIPDAQKNIRNLIDHFRKEYGVDLVALEGAAAKLDTQIFQSFPDKEALKKVFQEYHEAGELSGAVAAAIFEGMDRKGVLPYAPTFHGIEDWKLYEEGIGLYLQASQKDPEILQKLEVHRSKLEERKKKVYSRELLEVDQVLESFQRNGKDLVDVLKVLGRVKRPEVGNGRDRSLQTLLEEIERSEQDQSAIEREVREIAESIKKELLHVTGRRLQDEREAWSLWLAAFNQKYQAFQTSRISAVEFGLYLKKLIDEMQRRGAVAAPGFGMKGRGNLAPTVRFSSGLTHLMNHHKRLRDIEGTQFFREFEAYADLVKKQLFRNEEERAMDQESQILLLVERFARLELSYKDWKKLKPVEGRRSTADEKKDEVTANAGTVREVTSLASRNRTGQPVHAIHR